MKAVILAAGVGSRLGRPFPKALTALPSGEGIMGRQIRILKACGLKEIYVVVGFKKTIIMEHHPDVFYRYNPFFYITNTSKSLLCAVQDLDDDVLWVNGDVVFDEAIITSLAADGRDLVAVNRMRCGEEEVKYRTDDTGRITAISKSVEGAEGEAVGINLVRKANLEDLRRALDRCDDNDYFERGLELMIEGGSSFFAFDISEHRCIEVDFEEDLKQAHKLFPS